MNRPEPPSMVKLRAWHDEKVPLLIWMQVSEGGQGDPKPVATFFDIDMAESFVELIEYHDNLVNALETTSELAEHWGALPTRAKELTPAVIASLLDRLVQLGDELDATRDAER